MARAEFRRDLISALDVVQLASADILLFDFESVGLQVPDPGSATASARILIDRYGSRERRRLSLRSCKHRQNAQDDKRAQEESGFTCHRSSNRNANNLAPLTLTQKLALLYPSLHHRWEADLEQKRI